MFTLLRDALVLIVVVGLLGAGIYVNQRTIVVPAPEGEAQLGATSSEPVAVATTTSTVPEPTPEPEVQPTPSAAPKPAPQEVVKPPEPTVPKVEDLGITLDDAINSIGSLAAGNASSSTNDRVRAALVNIICTTATGGLFNSISGSGVIIDPRGVVLTNAHVAQFFLLKDYPRENFVECTVRSGSPAKPMYRAELMFLPPSWISNNAHKIVQEAPSGNGERDYALLRITGAAGPSIVLPAQFPFLLVSTESPNIGDDILQAGYAAGFLGGITIQNDLYASSAWTKVRDVFTFNANTADLFSLGGSVVAQRGSSGGPVADKNGVLMGVIVTASGTGDTATRDLHALATSYIVRDFEVERGKSLSHVLSTENLSAEVQIYNQVFAPSARAKLIAEIEN